MRRFFSLLACLSLVFGVAVLGGCESEGPDSASFEAHNPNHGFPGQGNGVGNGFPGQGQGNNPFPSNRPCADDGDCPSGEWCGFAFSGEERTCKQFVGEGERCEGFVLPENFERCEPGLICVFSEPTGDVPGTCTAADCEYNGEFYQAGDSFPAGDGCNTCSCTEGGLVACTLRACAPL